MIIGGIAAIAHGVPRVTRDVDAVVWGPDADIEELLASVAKRGLHPRIDDAAQFARESQVLLLRHEPSGVEVDVSLGWLPFEQEALARATETALLGFTARLAQPEDLVVYKALAWRPQDQQDIERLVALHGASMNLDRILRIVAELAEAIGTPERTNELAALIARAR